MIIDIQMPNLEGVTEATIVKWWKEVGDPIEKKEILLEVMTEKVNTEIESPVTGTVFEIIYPNDSVVKVGEVIAKIEQEN